MVDNEIIFIKVTDLIPLPGSRWGNYEYICQFTLILKKHIVSSNKGTFLKIICEMCLTYNVRFWTLLFL